MNFDVGKYGAFIWPAFGATLVVLVWMVLDSLWRAGHWRREADRLQAEKDARKAARATKP